MALSPTKYYTTNTAKVMRAPFLQPFFDELVQRVVHRGTDFTSDKVGTLMPR